MDPEIASEWPVWAMKGDLYHELGEREQAVEAYQRAVADDATDEDAWVNLADVLLDLGRKEEALDAYDHAIALNPQWVRYARGRAAALFQLQRNEEALAAYDRVLDLISNDKSALYWKGVTLWRLGREDEALATFDRILALQPDDANAWYWNGMATRGRGREEDALAAFDQALALDSDNVTTLRDRAASLFRLQRNDEALVAYDQVLALDPDIANTWYWKGVTLRRLGREEDAIAAFDRALALDPRSVEAMTSRAGALYNLKRYDDALAAYDRTLELKPDDKDAWYWKGWTLQALGRFEEALAALDEAQKRAPDDAAIREGRDALQRRMRRDIPDQQLRLPDGRTLGYLDFGDPNGFPIFYFHGMPGSRLELAQYEPLLRELHIRLITPERPGYGLSTYQPRRKILDWPDDVAALADHLGIARFAVLGASGGGPYAAACAYKLPERVTALGLVSSAAPPETVIRKFIWTPAYVSWRVARYSPMFVLRFVSSVWGLIARYKPEIALNVYIRRNNGTLLWQKKGDLSESPDFIPAPLEREDITEPFRQGGRGHARDNWLNAHAWGFQLDRITVPAHLWHGKRDVIAPPGWARYLAAKIPHCQATYYPNERHGVLNTHMREIFTALLAASTASAGERETEPGAAV
jgi:tetratricopeptide (TPR) repeat protein